MTRYWLAVTISCSAKLMLKRQSCPQTLRPMWLANSLVGRVTGLQTISSNQSVLMKRLLKKSNHLRAPTRSPGNSCQTQRH